MVAHDYSSGKDGHGHVANVAGEDQGGEEAEEDEEKRMQVDKDEGNRDLDLHAEGGKDGGVGGAGTTGEWRTRMVSRSD